MIRAEFWEGVREMGRIMKLPERYIEATIADLKRDERTREIIRTPRITAPQENPSMK